MKQITLTSLFACIMLLSICSIAQSTATYDVNFTSTWNSDDHGTLPGNAHWSDLVGVNHNNSVVFLEMGQIATTGVENIAETGSGGAFFAEVQSAINDGNAEQYINQSFSPFAAISSATFSNVVVSEEFPLLTLLSMIAPSPDWMIAVNGLNLWDTTNNNWKETFTVDLFPYDAGTEDGFGYSQENPETNPRGLITNIAGVAGYPFNSNKIGTLTVTFKSTTLSLNELETPNKIKVFPNPSNTGEITISSASDLSEVFIYDILGKKVKQLAFDSSYKNQSIDVSALNKGVYIIKLVSNTGSIDSKKLILN